VRVFFRIHNLKSVSRWIRTGQRRVLRRNSWRSVSIKFLDVWVLNYTGGFERLCSGPDARYCLQSPLDSSTLAKDPTAWSTCESASILKTGRIYLTMALSTRRKQSIIWWKIQLGIEAQMPEIIEAAQQYINTPQIEVQRRGKGTDRMGSLGSDAW
jgi:hypothetical protein